MWVKNIIAFSLNITFFIISALACPQEAIDEKVQSDKKLFRLSKQFLSQAQYVQERSCLAELVRRHPDSFLYNYTLGLNYYYTYHNKESALSFFETALKHSPKDTIGEIFYFLGDLYQYKGNFQKAVEAFTIMKRWVKKSKSGGELLKELDFRIAQCHEAQAMTIPKNKKVKVENLGSNINSIYADYSPVINKEKKLLIFTTRRNGSKKDYQDDKYFEDVYVSRKRNGLYEPAEKLMVSNDKTDLISSEHTAVINLINNEQDLVSYRNNGIWLSKMDNDGNWNEAVRLDHNINEKNSYQPHASFSADGKTIYFSSDRKDGHGGLDLYKSTLQPDRSWGVAENLSVNLNTKYNEDSPYISDDGTKLYFSSKGHNSIGGYDIFYSMLNDSGWSKPVNLGRPINSTADDIYYVPSDDQKQAYFASSRPGGIGDMDIYSIKYLSLPEFKDCKIIKEHELVFQELNGSVTFTTPGFLIEDKEVLFDASASSISHSEIKNVFWDFGDGSFSTGLNTSHVFKNKGIYEVKMELEAFHTFDLTTDNFCISRMINIKSPEELILVEAIKREEKNKKNDPAPLRSGELNSNNKDTSVISSVNRVPESEIIYFEFGKYNLTGEATKALLKNISLLNSKPEIMFNIVAHTDCIGNSDNNLLLSQLRANTVEEYLLLNGINPKRIHRVIGIGAAEPANKCIKCDDCNQEELKLNRRVELIVK